MAGKFTKHEFEIQKENIEQEIRGLEIEKLELARTIKENEVEAKKFDVDKSREDIKKSRLNYEAAATSNQISEQKLEQLKDGLEFEKALTIINRESLGIQGKTALLALQQAQADLEQNSELFELKYNCTTDVNLDKLLG